jgi:multidrug resistance protein MdtO
MAHQATAIAPSPVWNWADAWSFLKSELSPYPGRGWLVARMTMAAIIMMLCIVTFRMPGAALGAYYTMVISRDSTHATLDGVMTVLIALSLALAAVLTGALLCTGSPLLHFAWVVATLFITFFLISAATRYNFATAFGFLSISAIPIWDFPGNTDTAVSNALWTALSVSSGAVITAVLEVLFASLSGTDLIQTGVDHRLAVVSSFLRNVRDPEAGIKAQLAQYADIGMGQLRRLLIRTEGGNEDYARKAVLIGLTGRLVDICASVLTAGTSVSDSEQERLLEAAARIDQIRLQGAFSKAKSEVHTPLALTRGSFVEVLESTVQLMNDALEQPALMEEYTVPEDIPRPTFLKRDAFTNPEHLKFALRATAAALTCYIAYHLFDWRGIYNSVSTCMVTALSTTGSSRQKQALRISGAITGGLLLGIASEVFILPHIDSLALFTLLFGSVTAFAAWCATSSPRLSYYGLQVAFAFYVVQLRTFAPDTELTPARDTVAGILLGLIVMWVVFDQLSTHNALLDMRQALVSGIRALSAYMLEQRGPSRTQYLKRVRLFRDKVNESFLNVRTSADAVLFEFDEHRTEALKFRANARIWQPQLRTLLLLQITLAHMRLREPSGTLPASVERLLKRCAEELNVIADLIDRTPHVPLPVDTGGAEPLIRDEDLAAVGTADVSESLVRDSLAITNDLLKQVQAAEEERP